ncbi:adenosylcobinamide-GDP ribazoletransferase [Methylocella sp.]|jgi:adenosylcobinamide-GDP ribazoletransferase|uniref:adenosylcobinamide-GDP ribazoletransferase n=1 Tax=Methylocella sp. TaxID=1978226 RepID=UPI003C16B724
MRPGSSLLIDFLICLRFATRLPIPALPLEDGPHSLEGFARAAGALPLVGAILGAVAACALFAAATLGLPPLLAAPLAIAVLIALTGALHEDGLADCADGFGGGATTARKLEIMKDSRIGAFGALALAMALYLRIAALALIGAQSLPLAGAVLVGAAAASRGAALIPLALLPPARAEGAGFAAARPGRRALFTAACLCAVFTAAPLLVSSGLAKPIIAFGACVGAGITLSALARRQIGGQTGDVAGAAQQVAEILFYLVFAARL